jgi:hypothetical protein
MPIYGWLGCKKSWKECDGHQELGLSGRQLLRRKGSTGHRETTGTAAGEAGLRGLIEICFSSRLIPIFQKRVKFLQPSRSRTPILCTALYYK